jgi:hypothetical protein
VGPRWQREREKGEEGTGWPTRGAELSAREERGRRALSGPVASWAAVERKPGGEGGKGLGRRGASGLQGPVYRGFSPLSFFSFLFFSILFKKSFEQRINSNQKQSKIKYVPACMHHIFLTLG